MFKKLSFIVLCIIFSIQVYGQTLHLLIFINEEEENRQVDRRADMKNMKAFFRSIAQQIGYSYNLRANSSNEFTATEVNREISNLTIRKNDILVFYYGGHGYNQGSNIWPTFNFKDKNYWMTDILKRIYQKNGNAKLTLCIAACCNKGINNAKPPILSFNPSSSENMKALFTNFRGKKTILMSASKQGQNSSSHLKYGSLFGISFRKAIYELTDNSNYKPTWEKVKQKTRVYTLKISKNKQEPQFRIIVTIDSSED